MPLLLRVSVCARCPVLQGEQSGGGVFGVAGEPGPVPAGTARLLGCTCRLLRRGRASDLQASARPVNWGRSPLITAGPGCPARGAGSSHRGNFGFAALLPGEGWRHPLLPTGWDGAAAGTRGPWGPSEGEMLPCCFPRAAQPPERCPKKVLFLIKASCVLAPEEHSRGCSVPASLESWKRHRRCPWWPICPELGPD